jgi:SAM-dependent methyltransferase
MEQGMFNSITIDSTNSRTELCNLGVKYSTDKSPYNTDSSLHKHAYTSIYNLLFSNMRYKDIKLGELGILDNHSMQCWREFFPNAKLYGFEWFDLRIDKAINDNIDCTYIKMNVKDVASITEGLTAAGKFDILIEDSTHEFEDQIRFINEAYKHLKPGGILIIEDIFINANEADYVHSIDHLSDYFASSTFIFANHNLKNSAGWNNDKLLVLHRNDKQCS